ncbi:MAG: hypothetical protein IJP29_01515 [Lachnospiraceae bacterium]|nr:hypothetical protein [Lachnospiraceae bacterium]
MNRKRLGYIRCIICVVILLAACSHMKTTVSAEGRNGWYKGYYYVDGKIQKSTWVETNKGTYYVNAEGKKVTGWKKIKGRFYYFNEAKGGILRNSSRKTGVRLSKLSKDVLCMGIDMSQWQGNVNWKKIKASGVKFVMLRLGYGKGRYGGSSCTMDSKFRSYVEGAAKVGLPIGIYFYSYATTPKQALAEAEYTIDCLDGISVEFPVAYDIEDPAILEKTDNDTRTEMARTFMETIEAAGYTPMLYCNQNWYLNYLDSEKLSEYEFWYARYTYVEPDRTMYNCGMWQATSTQKLPGITENTVDLNFLYKDYFNTVAARSSALKYGWHDEGDKTYYYFQGKKLKTGWFAMAGEQYYLKNGAKSIGWLTIGEERYYFNEKGEMQTGFTNINGDIYLLNDDGVMQTVTDEPGVTINEDGTCSIKKGWYKNAQGKYFYRYASGNVAKNKWIKTKGKKYYVNQSGYRVTGLKKIDGKRYYFNEKGIMQKGFVTYKNNRYYFTNSGEAKTGWMKYKGKKYYFKKNGTMVRGKTISINGKKYRFNDKGHLVK